MVCIEGYMDCKNEDLVIYFKILLRCKSLLIEFLF